MKIISKIKIRLVISGCLLFFLPFVVLSKNYDFYVDNSVEESGDGSQAEPFKKISEAVEKGGDIFVKNGQYTENVELKKSTNIYGESETGVVLSGGVMMNDGTSLRNITVRGVKVAITVKAGADAQIEKCTIKDFSRVGVESEPGGGKLKVTDSKIKNGNGKGFFIQRGKTIELINNEIMDNDQEGVDIRSKVDGVVRGNFIDENKESGIELIVGSANLKIEANTITKNGASGIATQFYPELGGKGQVQISRNTIKKNKKYALDCNMPQGGAPSGSYWKDAIEMEGNSISAGKKKTINELCDIIDAVDEDEEMDNTIEEDTLENEIAVIESEPELTKEEEEKIQSEEAVEEKAKEQKIREIEMILDEQDVFNSGFRAGIRELEKESRIKIFFWGTDWSKRDRLLESLEYRERQLEQVKRLMEEIDMESEEEITIQKTLDEIQSEINNQRRYINNQKNSLGLWKRIKSLFFR